jgi:cellulose synthase/poly-beta-1,6-N-acetylglucosamine synthase-like glycosyltransferase
VYWAYLAFRHTFGMVLGYIRYQKEMKIDWLSECQKLDFTTLPDKGTIPDSLQKIKHFLLIPAYSEPEGVLRDSIDSVFSQTYYLNRIALIFTVEEKYSEVMIQRINKIIGDRKNLLYKFMIYVHPSGVPGEARGAAAANRTWGASHAVNELKELGECLADYIFSTIDADHVIDKQYLARLTHLYLTTDRRNNKYFSTAVHLFNNNIWTVPLIMRVEANAVTLGSLSDWVVARRTTKDTFSAYSSTLTTLVDAGYWDVALGVDDTIFYWRAFFARNGDFEGVPHFIPYSADAVKGNSLVDSYISLYRQLLRWGWGAIDFPLSMKEFIKNHKIPFEKKILWTIKHLQKRVLLINMVFLITFGFGIVTLVNPDVKQTNFAYSLPDLMSNILTSLLIFFIPATIVRIKMLAPFPPRYPFWKKIIAYLESPIIIFNLLTFSFFPFIEAQTRMLFGRRLEDLYHTPKVR